MHSSLIAAVLCFCALTAGAQCVGTAPLAQEASQGAQVIRASVVAAPAAPAPTPAAKPGGELIKAAAASTHDEPRMARDSSSATRNTQKRAHDEDDHPRRGGTAMLLAALALMSGIALRRSSSHGQ